MFVTIKSRKMENHGGNFGKQNCMQHLACRKPASCWPRRLIKYICSAARPEKSFDSAACGKPRTLPAIFMRPFLTTVVVITSLFSVYGQTKKSVKVRYDGLYQTVGDIDKEDNDTTYSFIRFYPSDTVITVASGGQHKI